MKLATSFPPSTLLMEEILHHLKSLKPFKLQESRAPTWCKISSINSMRACFNPKGLGFKGLGFKGLGFKGLGLWV